jgi:hypothetical protein
LKRLENSKVNAVKENKLKEMTGNKKSKRKLQELNRKIRHLIMLALKENNK